jgi:hypothetical protein
MESQMQLCVPGLSDFMKITEALQKKDAAMLWEAAKSSKSEAAFFDRLRDECSMAVYSVGSRRSQYVVNHHSALFMIPLIAPASAALSLEDPTIMKSVSIRLARWIQEWFSNSNEVTVFNTATSYQEICAWSPFDMREKLLQLSKQSAGSTAPRQEMDFMLPPSAPRLAFLIAGLQRPMEIPSLPKLDPVADEAFRSRIEGAIQVVSPVASMIDVRVDLPDYASSALLKGLIQWLDALHITTPILTWDATPAGNDAVYLQMVLDGEEPVVSRLILRAHQLGLDGVAQVLDRVAKLAAATPNPQTDELPKRTAMH